MSEKLEIHPREDQGSTKLFGSQIQPLLPNVWIKQELQRRRFDAKRLLLAFSLAIAACTGSRPFPGGDHIFMRMSCSRLHSAPPPSISARLRRSRVNE